MLGKGREMRQQEIPWWEQFIIGFEGDEEDDDDSTDDDSESEENDDEEDSEESEEESEDEDDESEDDDEPKIPAKDVKGLKKALRQERLARKRLEKQVKALQKKPDDAEDEDKDKGKGSTADAAKSKRLATRLRDQAVDNAILRFTDGFKHSDEVLKLVDRSEIDVDQDEEDPDEVEVDLDSVEEAVKALAKKSPHLLKSKEERSKSGSKMNGRRKKTGSTPSDDAIRDKYPALRR